MKMSLSTARIRALSGPGCPIDVPAVHARRHSSVRRIRQHTRGVARIDEFLTQESNDDRQQRTALTAPQDDLTSAFAHTACDSAESARPSPSDSDSDFPSPSSSNGNGNGNGNGPAPNVTVIRLDSQSTVAAAIAELRAALKSHATAAAQGLVRWEVALPRSLLALDFLRGQPRLASAGPRVYFSPRKFASPGGEGSTRAEACSAGLGSVAGVGAAWLWQGQPGESFDRGHLVSVNRFLTPLHPQIRVFGSLRFHQERTPAPEWAAFGPFWFLLPQLECQELPGCTLLSLQVAWSDPEDRSFAAAQQQALQALADVRQPVLGGSPRLPVQPVAHSHLPGHADWLRQVSTLRDSLATPTLSEPVADDADARRRERRASGSGASASSGMTKVVLARRTDFELRGRPDPLELLTALQERDPRAYQLLLELPEGPCFLGSTPERLYIRNGAAVATEAVAGTRPRGAPGDEASDARFAADLLTSPKEHAEFVVVRDWIERKLRQVCGAVEVEKPKTLLRQEAVQHLYGRLAGTLERGKTDSDLLRALHPTPAVCGQPREESLAVLHRLEPFDRGLYSGPFGWISGDSSEFIVAIRSALVHPPPAPAAADGAAPLHRVSLYAGVGIVQGADPQAEWQELNLKIGQFEKLLQGPPPLRSLPNVNAVWAYALVEELCRLGVSTFCIAPGSRSSPLSVAAASHPRAKVVMCIDERSLGFYALGHSKGKGRPCAVITSSGTAVANLLPAVVEASQSHVPLVVITADRPAEVRDTGSNQTIDQVKIFGPYVRWECDLPAPDGATKARVVVSAADTAVRRALGPVPGPVHLNFPCREPLAPTKEAWPPAILEGLSRWEADARPFTAPVAPSIPGPTMLADVDPDLLAILTRMQATRRGMIVAAGLTDHRDVAAAAMLGRALHWPVVADTTSGLRVFGARDDATALPTLLSAFDHVLLQRDLWEELQPEVILQLGSFLTSKRVAQFLSWAALKEVDPAAWFYVSPLAARHDPSQALSAHVAMDVPAFAHLLLGGLEGHAPVPAVPGPFLSLLQTLNDATAAAIRTCFPDDLASGLILTEPLVARAVADQLPPGHALYLGNSMPIRDMDMFGGVGLEREAESGVMGASPYRGENGVGVPVSASRGASGIDGVSSAAIGYAEGLGRPVTLLVGDVSFLHDANGLTLLRGGQGRPPVTIVLVNNGGGGIFSFLPIAQSIPAEVFEPVFATPPGVSFPDMSRAHSIAHHVVQTPAELHAALNTAWTSQQHAIVEVLVPDRQENFAIHQRIQEASRTALGAARAQWREDRGLAALQAQEGARTQGQAQAAQGRGEISHDATSTHTSGTNHASVRRGMGTGGSRGGPVVRAAAGASVLSLGGPSSVPSESEPDAGAPERLLITTTSVHPFSIPLERPLTTRHPSTTRLGALLFVKGQAQSPSDSDSEGSCSEQTWSASGVGEMAPLAGLHKESHRDALAQLLFLGEQLQGCSIAPSDVRSAAALDAWIWERMGIDPADLYPSVRSALEMALTHLFDPPGDAIDPAATVEVNGLLDGIGASESTLAEAMSLYDRGFRTLKLKVGRLQDPTDDAKTVAAVVAAARARGTGGAGVSTEGAAAEPGNGLVPERPFKVRLDANRLWDLENAMRFATELERLGVTSADMDYIEEPCRTLTESRAFALQFPWIPLALDESLDDVLRTARAWTDALNALRATVESFQAAGDGVRLAALVVKPAVIGGVLRCQDLAGLGVPLVVSSSFESAVGLAACAVAAAKLAPPGLAHGLGTLAWFQRANDADVSASLGIDQTLTSARRQLEAVLPVAPLSIAATVLDNTARDLAALREPLPATVAGADYSITARVATDDAFFDLHALEFTESAADACGGAPTVVFLHGFSGDATDFAPFARSLSRLGIRCLSIDLPGHGLSRPVRVDAYKSDASAEETGPELEPASATWVDRRFSIDAAAQATMAFLRQTVEGPVCLVGYSLGGRVALSAALSDPQWAQEQLACLMILSSTPGLEDDAARTARAAQDDQMAKTIARMALPDFLQVWYRGALWTSLREHPAFPRLLAARGARAVDVADMHRLATCLSSMSPGRMVNLWPYLSEGSLREVPSYWVTGSKDAKFQEISKKAAECLATKAPVEMLKKSIGTQQHGLMIRGAAGVNGELADDPVGEDPGAGHVRSAVPVVVEGAGHAVHLERPLAVLQLLLKMVDAHTAS